MPVSPEGPHSSTATEHPEGLFVLNPAELAALTFVLTRAQGAGYPALASGGPRTRCSSHRSGAPSRHLGAQKAEGRRGTSLHAGNSHPWFALCQVLSPSLHLYPTDPQALEPLNITDSTSWRDGSKIPRLLVRLAFRKGHQRKPGSSTHFIRNMIFGVRPGFEPYCDYLLASQPWTSNLTFL